MTEPSREAQPLIPKREATIMFLVIGYFVGSMTLGEMTGGLQIPEEEWIARTEYCNQEGMLCEPPGVLASQYLGMRFLAVSAHNAIVPSDQWDMEIHEYQELLNGKEPEYWSFY